jgi:hypothetical protein
MAQNTNIPFVEVIPLHVVLVLINFTVSPVLRSTSVMNFSVDDATAAVFWSINATSRALDMDR